MVLRFERVPKEVEVFFLGLPTGAKDWSWQDAETWPRAVDPEQKDLIDKNLGPSRPELEQKTKSDDHASLRRASMMD